MNDWFTIRAQSPGAADVAITGTIEPGTARAFLGSIPPDARTIRLSVSSLGGDAQDALTIARALRAHRARVEVAIHRIAASAATVIVSAGDRVTIDPAACTMLHNPHLVPTDGTPRDARALRAAAADLDRIKAQILDVYTWRLRHGREAIARLMDDTTWWNPAEAVAAGLADEVRSATTPTVPAHIEASAFAALGPIPPRFAALIAELRTGSRHSLAPPPARDPRDSWKASHERLDRRMPARFNVFDVYRQLNQGGSR